MRGSWGGVEVVVVGIERVSRVILSHWMTNEL